MMVVTAHPDDEASSFGGSLRLYQERGVETCIICLTSGTAATHRGSARSDQELGELRRKEFAAACEILKVSRGTVLDYPDGQLHRLDMQRVVSDLTLRIREFQPQVLLTFDAAGSVTGHTDHTMASVFATLAFHWAGRSNRFPDQLTGSITPHRIQKLYHTSRRLHSSRTSAHHAATDHNQHRDRQLSRNQTRRISRTHQPATTVGDIRRARAKARRAGAISSGGSGERGPGRAGN